MLTLPDQKGLDVITLSRCFKSTANSYKFYWFLAILDHIASSETEFISLNELSMRMLSCVWYPLDFYKLSFGKQDGFKDLAAVVSEKITVDNSVNAPSLLAQIEKGLPEKTAIKLKHKIKMGLKRWVTYRFLSPFFQEQVRGLRDQEVNDMIAALSNEKNETRPVPYAISTDGITLNKEWLIYFKDNQLILRGFINWYLVKFVQKNNPNVIGLTEKLGKPAARNLKNAKTFWSEFLYSEAAQCIYSQDHLDFSSFSLDHFIPWSYVAHDQLWNIIPTTRSINSSKSDGLPNLGTYLERYCDLHYHAFNYHFSLNHFRLLEDYSILFKGHDLSTLDRSTFNLILSTEITAHHRIAGNMGFKQFCFNGKQNF